MPRKRPPAPSGGPAPPPAPPPPPDDPWAATFPPGPDPDPGAAPPADPWGAASPPPPPAAADAAPLDPLAGWTDPAPEAPYEWVCASCGWRYGVTGMALREFTAAMDHAYPKHKQWRHRIQGCYDRTTGERLCGLDSTAFRRAFGLPGGKRAAAATAPGDAAPGAPSTAGGGGGGGGRGRKGAAPGAGTTALPGRRLRVLAQDVQVSDVVTLAFHLVARKFPEVIPPELLATEELYTSALAQFVEDAVVLALDQLHRQFPHRFTVDDVRLAAVATWAPARLAELAAPAAGPAEGA